MFDYKCVPEPLSIVLNMVVDPFLGPKRQTAERVQCPDVVEENTLLPTMAPWSTLWRVLDAYEEPKTRPRCAKACVNGYGS